jgi:hypothetical protein
VPAFAAPVFQASASVDDHEGDNSGTLDPGESTSLVVVLTNVGDQEATAVAGTLSTTTPGASVTDAGPKTIGAIAVNASMQADFGVSLDSGYACGNDVAFDIAITSDQGSSSAEVNVPVPCPTPSFSVSNVSLTDATTKAPVKAATVGEVVDVKIDLSNDGEADATNVTGTLSGDGANVTQPGGSFGGIAKGATGIATFQVVPTVCPETDSLFLSLDISSDQVSAHNLGVPVPVDCPRIGFTRGTWDDRATGNGDGQPQRGETGLVFIQLSNPSAAAITGLSATLTMTDADVTGGPVTFPDVAPGESTVSTEAFMVRVHDDAPVPFPGTTGLSDQGCAIFNMLSGLTLEGDQPHGGTAVAILSGTLHVTFDQGTAGKGIDGAAVCAETLQPTAGPGSPIAATGGIRFDLLWLALVITACGAVLRRASAIKL